MRESGPSHAEERMQVAPPEVVSVEPRSEGQDVRAEALTAMACSMMGVFPHSLGARRAHADGAEGDTDTWLLLGSGLIPMLIPTLLALGIELLFHP